MSMFSGMIVCMFLGVFRVSCVQNGNGSLGF